jgi:hypothetical protein
VDQEMFDFQTCVSVAWHRAQALGFINVNRAGRYCSHGKMRRTSGIKWTTSDDDFDISIAMIGHGAG